MPKFVVAGWCPSAWQPMLAGDGWIMRVRPRLARLTATQVGGLCTASRHFGNGLIDLTSRANLQIRGVRQDGVRDLLERLVELDLVDRNPELEARRAILVAPEWRAGDDSEAIIDAFALRLPELPALPGKFGFAVDAGIAPSLTQDSADVRIERSSDGGLILRADGRKTGMPVTRDTAVDAMIALARWFVATGGNAAGRMVRHRVPLPAELSGQGRPAPARAAVIPGNRAYGLPFGRVEAPALAALMNSSGGEALRITPWHIVILENGVPGDVPGLTRDPAEPTMRASACPGAPACPQATVATRALASRLAPHVAGRLHVSGCAKGCAHPGMADVTLTGRDGRFDLARAARAGESPERLGLSSREILAHFGVE